MSVSVPMKPRFSCRDQYRQALTYFMQKEPFYYHFVSQLRYREVESLGPNCAGAALGYEDGVFILILDKNVFPTHDLEVAVALICHELHHHIYQHLLAPYAKSEPEVWNWATDIAINDMMPYRLWDGALTSTVVQQMLNITEPFPPKKSAQFYYKILLKYKDKLKPQQKQAAAGSGPGNQSGGQPDPNGKPQESQGGTNHSQWQSMTPEQKRIAKLRLGRMSRNAKEKANNKLPGTIAGMIEELIKALKPRVDWRKPLRNWTGRRGDVDIFYTYAQQNKYGGYPKITLMPGCRLAVFIDTSGSMGDRLVAQCLGELEGAAKYKEVYWTTVDAQMYGKMQRFKKAKDAKYKTEGGGGTDMRLIFDYLNKYYPDYFDGVIVLTDMYTPFPTKQQVNGRKVLWANCSGEDFTKRIPNGIGKVIDVFDTSKLDCNWEDQGAAV